MARALWYPTKQTAELRSTPLPALRANEVEIRATHGAVSRGTEARGRRVKLNVARRAVASFERAAARARWRGGSACRGSEAARGCAQTKAKAKRAERIAQALVFGGRVPESEHARMRCPHMGGAAPRGRSFPS